MPWKKGQSGNPGGRRHKLFLTEAVRMSEGQKAWVCLMKMRDGLVLERKQVGIDVEGTPIMADVVLDGNLYFKVVEKILAYCIGLPTQKIDFESQEGKAFAFAVVVNPQSEEMLKGSNEQRSIQSPIRPNGIGFDFGG